MSRLIIVPQYPAKLRYQQWWIEELPLQLGRYFDQVVTLGGDLDIREVRAKEGDFSPINDSIVFETFQIREYLSMDIRPDDVLLLCDLSFPGFFSNVLFHKRPKKCFAICHATSKNRYDYFMDVHKYKYPIEKASSKLFTEVFVASWYHYRKLKWKNIRVLPFPLPPFSTGLGEPQEWHRRNNIVSVARPGKQKVNKKVEDLVTTHFKTFIKRPENIESWDDYYNFLCDSRVLLITAKEETFGYQIVDALINGCIPVAPNTCSYPELLPKKYLYNDFQQMICIINNILEGKYEVPKLLVQKESEDFYKNLAKRMTYE